VGGEEQGSKVRREDEEKRRGWSGEGREKVEKYVWIGFLVFCFWRKNDLVS
jgi:hypothetical protein